MWLPATVTTTTKSVYKRKQNAQVLASGYSAGKRRLETLSLVLFGMLLCMVLCRGVQALLSITWSASTCFLLVFAWLLGMASADFVSGVAHWIFDTWGTTQTPVFNTFIRSFREHHVDPMAITRHDLIETNGDNAMLVVPLLAVLVYAQVDLAGSRADLVVYVYLLAMGVMLALTNQIHKWSHQLRPTPLVRLAQATNIILSRRVHNIHHQSPYDRYYCITTGWLNPLLGAVDFWATLEAALCALMGATPRQDDAFWTQST